MPKFKVEYKVVHRDDETFVVKQVKKVVDDLPAALAVVQDALQSQGLQRLTVQEVKPQKPQILKEVKK